MEKFKGTVKYIKRAGYSRQVGAWSSEDVNVYKFEDEDGNIYVWKTTKSLGRDIEVKYAGSDYTELGWESMTIGSVFTITASINCEQDYKGEHQIVLQRVKVIDVIDKVPTKEELDEQKRKEQLASIKDGDFIWKEMPYKQYKEHYADCEAVAGTFRREDFGGAYIDVIIRKGRLVNSGTRGQRFDNYYLYDSKGQRWCFWAVSPENAMKQARKYSPEEVWSW